MTINTELSEAFQARHLAVPMSQAFAVGPDESCAPAALALRERSFDQAPVVDGGVPIGFVLTRRLYGNDGRVRQAMSALGSGNVVSADASIGHLLDWIMEPGFLFVLQGREVTGFITVSDFNKQPARGYLYLLLARLETGVAALIRARFAEDQSQAVTLLSGDNEATVRDRFEADREAGAEGDVVTYLDFSDLVQIVGRDEESRSRLGARSRNSWSEQTGGLVQLRNDVMHPVRNIVLAKGG